MLVLTVLRREVVVVVVVALDSQLRMMGLLSSMVSIRCSSPMATGPLGRGRLAGGRVPGSLGGSFFVGVCGVFFRRGDPSGGGWGGLLPIGAPLGRGRGGSADEGSIV